MKKNNYFVPIVLVAALAAGILIFMFLLGDPSHFKDGVMRTKPADTFGTIYSGGFIVPVLLMLTIMVFTFIIERFLSLAKATGKGDLNVFLVNVEKALNEGNIDASIDICNRQRGTVANILRAGLERFKEVRNDGNMPAAELKLAEVKRTMEEATTIETPLLERNLVGLSTIASISTMIGLLGTVLGMIRAFKALGEAGAASATQLSVGISEALINTAFGIFGAIIAIVFYNFFTTKVDGFVYMIDEACLNLTETLNTRFLGRTNG